MTHDEQYPRDSSAKAANTAPRRHFGRPFILIALLALSLLVGCYERKQTATLNPDGSGKIRIETVVVVPAQGPPGQEKPNALSYGRLVAADLINLTRGVEAWADLSISEVENPPGRAGPVRARIAVTAYFKDLNDLRFDKLPLDFVWKRDETGATLSVQRTRTAARSSTTLSEADIKDLMAKSREDYKNQRQALETQLNAFTLDMTFELPGDVADTQIFSRDGTAIALAIDGKKAMQALDKFMADDAALEATFKAGQDLAVNDDLLLESMYGRKGPARALVKIAPDAKPAFDYRTEVVVAELARSQMLKAAGVELLPKVIVTTSIRPATRPVTQPATLPATRGR